LIRFGTQCPKRLTHLRHLKLTLSHCNNLHCEACVFIWTHTHASQFIYEECMCHDALRVLHVRDAAEHDR
jgi:hypothetical protein